MVGLARYSRLAVASARIAVTALFIGASTRPHPGHRPPEINRHIAVDALDLQPISLECSYVVASRNEVDFVARVSESWAEIAANTAGAEGTEFHTL
ncbi:hypothetical protein GCM10009006_01280 [Haloarcula argentinensis]|uniref:Uncharacterized protein n=1 Tax=Haloarcula argentinensis TaxID=43776 RepID=A0A830FQ02_HALAR|nr:hypothetical protein GCM10009006_01280 [Haloarcula argentinensis]